MPGRHFLRTQLLLLVIAILLSPARRADAQAIDTDGDGLPDAWEVRFGLDPSSAASPNGAADDPDGDGLTNLQELDQGGHPRGFHRRWLAEGASNTFFQWRLALANPEDAATSVLVSLLTDEGQVVRLPLEVGARQRRTLTSADIAQIDGSFSTMVESDVEIAVDRTMTWNGGLGSHAEGAVAAPGRRWYLAEGSTGGAFNLFYLIQNTSSAVATVNVSYLLPEPQPPLHIAYTVPPRSRYTIWVDQAAPELAGTDVSAEFVSDQDIVVERAMYFDGGGVPFRAGHAAAAVPAPALEWYLAEGATGDFFDTYVLLANPGDTWALVQTDYLLPDGMAVPRNFAMAPHSRHTVRIDDVHPWLADAAVSVRVRSRNGVPIVVERSMWWPDGQWIEAHASPGALSGGTRWMLADGEAGGGAATATYALVANISDWAANVRVSLLFEDGGEVHRDVTVPALSRFTFDPSSIPEAINRRFGTLVESIGARPAELVVERSMYNGAGWEAGTSSLGANLSTPLRQIPDLVLFRGSGLTTVDVYRPRPGGALPSLSVTSSGVVGAALDPQTHQLKLNATTPGSATVTVNASVPGRPDETVTFVVTVSPATTVQFGPVTDIPGILFPAVTDTNGDDWPELVGTVNDGTGHLVPLDITAIGLGPLKEPDRRENHPVDVNGDGRPDIVTWKYLPITNPLSLARLFIAQPDGTYVEDPAFAALEVRGWGHTILGADLDNDGDTDLFMVNYTQNDPREQFHLLLNDGTGHFREVADAAGVANRNWPYSWKSEGAQAVDFDGDGYLDLFAASHFYFNTGVVDGIPRFVDRRADLGLPLRFDEGLMFFDSDNDGRLDLLLHHPSEGPQVWRFDGTRFSIVAMPLDVYDASYGANVYDMNGDGLEDIVLASGCCPAAPRMRIFLNTGRGFVLNPLTTLDGVSSDIMSFGDFDRDGRIDIGRRSVWSLGYAMNVTPKDGLSTITLDIVDAQGGHTQFGRVVRVRPRQAPGVVYTRIVDGGSSLMSLNQYPILIGTPYDGDFDVTVRFADGDRTWVVTAGDRARLFADGRKAAF